MTDEYVEGFAAKCAEVGIDPEVLLKGADSYDGIRGGLLTAAGTTAGGLAGVGMGSAAGGILGILADKLRGGDARSNVRSGARGVNIGAGIGGIGGAAIGAGETRRFINKRDKKDDKADDDKDDDKKASLRKQGHLEDIKYDDPLFATKLMGAGGVGGGAALGGVNSGMNTAFRKAQPGGKVGKILKVLSAIIGGGAVGGVAGGTIGGALGAPLDAGRAIGRGISDKQGAVYAGFAAKCAATGADPLELIKRSGGLTNFFLRKMDRNAGVPKDITDNSIKDLKKPRMNPGAAKIQAKSKWKKNPTFNFNNSK